jgi:hypothetical protein
VPMSMQRIGGDDAALEREQLDHLQCACHLVAPWRFALRQRQLLVRRSDVDQVQRCGARPALEGSAHRTMRHLSYYLLDAASLLVASAVAFLIAAAAFLFASVCGTEARAAVIAAWAF